jgi:drug/metabolite transporter (DMT)-like permease
MTKQQIGYFLAVYAAATVGSSVAVSTRISAYPRLGGLSFRYGMAAIVLAVIVSVRKSPWPRVTRRDGMLLVLLAATGMVGFNLFLLGAVDHADPGAVGAIVGSVPILLALVGPLQAGRSPTSRALIASVVVVAGAALAEGAGSVTWLGLVLAIGALGGEAAFSLLATPILPRLGPMFVATFACAIASVMSLLTGFAVDGGGVVRSASLSEGLSIVYLGITVSGLGFFAWYTAIVSLGVDRAGLFSGVTPVFALLTGWALATNDPNPFQFLGVLIVGAGVTLGIRQGKTQARGASPADGAILHSPANLVPRKTEAK